MATATPGKIKAPKKSPSNRKKVTKGKVPARGIKLPKATPGATPEPAPEITEEQIARELAQLETTGLDIDGTPARVLQPWEQQPGEPERWYQVFREFLMDGPTRTLLGTYKRLRGIARDCAVSGSVAPETVTQAWREYSRQWNWRDRAVQYDAWQAQQREQRRAEREAALEEKLFNTRETLVDKVGLMLQFPLEQTRVEGADGKTIIVEPAKWTFDTVSKFLMAQAKLAEVDGIEVKVKAGKNGAGSVAVGVDLNGIEGTDSRRSAAVLAILDRGRARALGRPADESAGNLPE